MADDELQLMQDWIVDTLKADNNRSNPGSLESLILPHIPAAEQAAFELWTRIIPGGGETPHPFLLLEYLAPARPFGINGQLSNGGGDLTTVNGEIVWTTHAWRVTWRIERRRMKALAPLVRRTHTLLHRKGPLNVTGGEIVQSMRDPHGLYQRTLQEEGKWFSIKGADYVVTSRPL